MIKKLSIVCVALLSALCIFSCSSGDDDDKEVSSGINLSEETEPFVGYWKIYQASKGGDFIFFRDGTCWMYPLNASNEDSHDDGYWDFDSETKILATTTNSWQWQVTLSNQFAWAGISLGNSTIQTFKKDTVVADYAQKLLAFSNWEEATDSILKLYAYETFYSNSNTHYSVYYLGYSKIAVGKTYIEFTLLDGNLTSAFTFTYKIYNIQKNSNRYNNYYTVTKVGEGTARLTNPDSPTKSKLKLEGTISKTLKRLVN
jgi:hypothetical protein